VTGALRVLTAAVGVAFFVPAFFVAVVLPYHSWDSLAFGSWSRIIGETGSFSSSAVSDAFLHRPLFYALQGWAWYLVGYHEWLGRSLSVLFGALLVVSVWYVAGRLVEPGTARELFRFFSAACALSSAVLARWLGAGMSDVPVAAMAAATAALLWSPLGRRMRFPLVAVLAAGTVLAKPTGLVALAGVALARAIIVRSRVPAWRLLAAEAAAVVAGVAAALGYALWQASRLNESLTSFLTAGNTAYDRERGDAVRWDVLLRADWLGSGLRLAFLYALVLSIALASGLRARFALAAAAAVALAGSVAGPAVAGGGIPPPLEQPGLGLVAYFALALAMVAAPFVAAGEPFGRPLYWALLAWLAPAAGLWVASRPDDARLLSGAWPAAALLTAAALTVVTIGLARLSPVATAVPVGAMALLVLLNVPSIDGLGREGWRGLLELGPNGWRDRAAVENYAYGPFSYELDAARRNVGPGETIISSDGRLTYFFPRHVEVSYPRACSDVAGRRLFVLLTSGESVDIMTRLYGGSADPLAWLQCERPRLRLVHEQSGVHAAFVTGTPSMAPLPADCGVTSAPGQDLDAVFGKGLTYGEARALYQRAFEVGFTGGLKIQRTGCDTFRVVLAPVPPEARADLIREAESVGLALAFADGVAYPEVPPGVEPAGP
jgi:hypothetical protein